MVYHKISTLSVRFFRSFRLKNKRPLGQLMITNSGCSVLEPGIGDIAFVKDLQTDTIVSTTFECSIFGGVQSSQEIGWVGYCDTFRLSI